MLSRRYFVAKSFAASAAALPDLHQNPVSSNLPADLTKVVSLNGEWSFRTDPGNSGQAEGWQKTASASEQWSRVRVPHTWQIEAPLADYRGIAWYHKRFEVADELDSRVVRVEFEAVFHTAKVWVNGNLAGEHSRKGYTAFTFDVTPLLIRGAVNTITVRVDNAFDEHMLPRGRSSDWAHDGGIYRPVQLLVTPHVFVERVDADEAGQSASLNLVAYIQNATARAQSIALSYRVIDDATGLTMLSKRHAATATPAPRTISETRLSAAIPQPKLWHFDSPNLYRLEVTAQSGGQAHTFSTTFGIRRFEVRETAFYLNGERVKLMGVERMAGSNPEYGMAEPAEWITRDHEDLKHLNCVFTRVHWPQDKRVLDYCDRHGILIQTEVPAWGPNTFKGMGDQPDSDIMQNGIEQFREMAARDRNHPCIGSWGLCNEISGQHAPAYNFAKNMLAEAKRIDPNRLCSYASHSLFKTPGQDVSGLMDFVSCNEYFGSWQKGGPADLAQMIDNVHSAFPGKPIVISEYGYCACTADRPEGDEHREYVLRSQDEVLRQRDYIAGLIFFCYNDYRTHVGDKGLGVLKQRVHGVVDLYGERKASYERLRFESSPIESLTVRGDPTNLEIALETRNRVPMHAIRGYKLRAVFYGYGDIPVERLESAIPALQPGESVTLKIAFSNPMPLRIVFDVIRPTGFSAYSQTWRA